MKFRSNKASIEAKAQESPPRTINPANPHKNTDSIISFKMSQIFGSFFLKVITMKKKIPAVITGKIQKKYKS